MSPAMGARRPACLSHQYYSPCRSRFVLARYDGRGTWNGGPGLRCLPIHRPGTSNLSRFEHPQKSLDLLPLQAMSQDTITGANSIATPTQSQGVVVAACGRGATKSVLETHGVDIFVSEARHQAIDHGSYRFTPLILYPALAFISEVQALMDNQRLVRVLQTCVPSCGLKIGM